MGLFDFFSSKRAPLPPAPQQPQKPLILFAEMRLSKTKGCRKELHKIAHITDKNGYPVSFGEALNIYYGQENGYCPWSFSINDVRLQREGKTYSVIGEGIILGQVSTRDIESIRMIDELIYINKIDHLRVSIKDCSYFYLTEEEYREYVSFDPYNKGFPSWAEDRSPEITLYVYFEDGLLNLRDFGTDLDIPDPDEFLK